MKYFIILFTICFLSQNLYSQEYDVRNLKWGMGHSKVMKIEKQQGNEMFWFENKPNPSFLDCTGCFKIGDYGTRLTYKFSPESDKLFEANIEIFYSDITQENETFEFVYGLLQEKFGGPGEKHYTGDLLPDGTRSENVFYLWENERSWFVFEHPFIGFKNFVITYTSKQYLNTALDEVAKLSGKKIPGTESEEKNKQKTKQEALDQL